MKQYRPLLFIVITLLIGWTLLIQEACAQQLKQIQKGTANNQIPVTNGYQNTQVYRNAIPYILDTLGIRDSLADDQTLTLLDSINRVFRLQISNGNTVKWKAGLLVETDGSTVNELADFYENNPPPPSSWKKGDLWYAPSIGTLYISTGGVPSLVWKQADWNESNTGLQSYIKNKPDIGGMIHDSLGTIVSAPDSTFIKKLWGITLDSVGNTYSIGADSAQVTSIYQNSLKQNLLISGTNIKTVNSNSLLGSGNISVGTVTGTGTSPRVAYWDGTGSLNSTANLRSETNYLFTGYNEGIHIDGSSATYASGIKFRNNGYAHCSFGLKGSEFVFSNTSSDYTTLWPSPTDRLKINMATGMINIPNLDTDLTPPSTSGTTRMVISDNVGNISFSTNDILSGSGTSPRIAYWNGTNSLTSTSNLSSESSYLYTGYSDGIHINGSSATYASGIKFRNNGYAHCSFGMKGSSFVFSNTSSNSAILWPGTPSDKLEINMSSGQLTSAGLTGTGSEMVVASSTGVLSRQAIPTGDITGVTVSAPITGGGTSGSVNIALDTTSTTGAFTNYKGTLKQNKLTGATGQTLYFSATNTPTATYQVFINGSGQVGINNPSPAYHLDVSGSMHASAGFYDSSGDFGNAGQVLTGQGYAATNWETPPTASSSVTGYLSNTDWTTFNNKVGGSGTTNKLAYWNGTTTIAANGNFHLDNTNSTLSIGVGSAGTYPLDIQSNGASQALRAMNAATTKGFTVTPTTTANAQSVGVYGNILIDGQIHSSTQTPAYGTSGQVLTSQGTGDWIWTTPSSGTVSSFSSGNLSPLFTTSVSNSTTTPALSFSLSSVANANYIYASPNGSSGTPSFRAIVPADIPTLNQNTTGTAGSAGALITPQTIGIVTGDATSAGSSFNGTANNTNALTLATVNSNVGSFTNATITVNAKGLITAASSGASSATNLSFTGASSPYTLNSSTGTDVTFTAGSNITLSGSASNLTINNPAPDQVISITGAGTNVVTGAYPSFTITDKSTTTQTFTSSGTYTKPAGAKSVYVRVIGAGGGGGGGSRFATSTFTPGGGGGNGGGISEYTFHADDVPSSVSVIVGTGGGGGAGATSNDTEGTTGTTGGVSNFGTLLYAEGGLGGKSFDAQKASLGVIEDGGVGAYYSGAGAAFTAANTKVSPTGGGAGGYISAANATNNTNVTAGTLILTSNAGTPNTGIRSGIGGVGGNASTSGNGSAGTAAAATGYGAGGGGGGAARNSVGNGGAGASGRQGAVIVITYF